MALAGSTHYGVEEDPRGTDVTTDPWECCSICDLPLTKGGCEHTPEQRKQYEIDVAWENHEWEDPSSARIRLENQRYDEDRGAYNRTYRGDEDEFY